jgi:inner membrane transporter RhtA
MATTSDPAVARRAERPTTARDLRLGVLTMLASGTSNQTGAATGARAFDAIGPAGVVAIRQFVAAALLLPTVRPPLRTYTRAQWWPVIGLALVFATMNICLYTATDRIGIGLAVTLEFLGPLVVALLSSRTRRDLMLAGGAGAGVYVLVLPGASSDWFGIGLGVAAAAAWAAYILLNRVAGERLPGLQAPATATLLSAAIYVPVAIVVFADRGLPLQALLLGATAGVLSSVVPYTADVLTLRLIPARLFGVFMSVNPVVAALAGVVILGQLLDLHEWIGILVVVTTNASAVAGQARTRPHSALERSDGALRSDS